VGDVVAGRVVSYRERLVLSLLLSALGLLAGLWTSFPPAHAEAPLDSHSLGLYRIGQFVAIFCFWACMRSRFTFKQILVFGPAWLLSYLISKHVDGLARLLNSSATGAATRSYAIWVSGFLVLTYLWILFFPFYEVDRNTMGEHFAKVKRFLAPIPVIVAVVLAFQVFRLYRALNSFAPGLTVPAVQAIMRESIFLLALLLISWAAAPLPFLASTSARSEDNSA
jgi:hypothetical protein